MTITDERLAEIAKEAVTEAIQDLAHDRMGHGELLQDEPGVEGMTEAGQDELCERLEAEIRKHLPPDQTTK